MERTAAGAWESGQRAADAVVRHILGQPEPAAPKAEIERPSDRPVRSNAPSGQRPTQGSGAGWCYTNPNDSYCQRPSRRGP